MSMDDLYNMALRNGFYLPKRKSAAINESMLFNILQGHYWCPKFQEIRLQSCLKPPMKEVLFSKILDICQKKNLNIAWIDDKHMPNKEWIVTVLATLSPDDEIFKKDYVAPPVRRRQKDIETIMLPNELFDNLPKSTSKVKARRLKIMSEAFASEKAQRLKDMQKEIFAQIAEHEVKREKYETMKRAKTMMTSSRLEEEKKGDMNKPQK